MKKPANFIGQKSNNMPELRNFYNYCLQSPKDVEDALRKLSSVKTQERFHFYLNAILDKLASSDGEKRDITRSVVSFVDKDLILDFIKKPDDAFKFVDLSKQLVMTAAGMGVMIEPMPYDQDDLLSMQEGTFKFYHDVPFAYTLNRIIEGGEEVSVLAEVLLGFLQFDDKEPERGAAIKWETAFLLNLLMHAVWRHFGALSDDGMKLLLDHYVYVAIVGGVPVRRFLKNYVYLSGERSVEKEDFVIASLLTNKEEIPFDTACAQWKMLPDIVKNYTTKLGNEPSSGFKQEEFLQGFYQGQKNRDIFRNWLREVLNIATNLGI